MHVAFQSIDFQRNLYEYCLQDLIILYDNDSRAPNKNNEEHWYTQVCIDDKT